MQFPESAERPSGPWPWFPGTFATSSPPQCHGALWDICHPASVAPSHDNWSHFCMGGNVVSSKFNSRGSLEYFQQPCTSSRPKHSRTFHSPSHSDWFRDEHIAHLGPPGKCEFPLCWSENICLLLSSDIDAPISQGFGLKPGLAPSHCALPFTPSPMLRPLDSAELHCRFSWVSSLQTVDYGASQPP